MPIFADFHDFQDFWLKVSSKNLYKLMLFENCKHVNLEGSKKAKHSLNVFFFYFCRGLPDMGRNIGCQIPKCEKSPCGSSDAIFADFLDFFDFWENLSTKKI